MQFQLFLCSVGFSVEYDSIETSQIIILKLWLRVYRGCLTSDWHLKFEIQLENLKLGNWGLQFLVKSFQLQCYFSNYVGEGSWKNWVVEEFYVLESKSYYLSWKVRNEFVRRTIFQLQETITIRKTHPTLDPSVFCTCWWSESLIKLSD